MPKRVTECLKTALQRHKKQQKPLKKFRKVKLKKLRQEYGSEISHARTPVSEFFFLIKGLFEHAVELFLREGDGIQLHLHRAE